MKRFISLLLVLTMLPISAFAGGSITPGAGSGSSGSNGSGTSAGYTTRTLGSNTGAGLYLGVYTAKTAIAISTKSLGVMFADFTTRGSNTTDISASRYIGVANISNALFGTWSGTINYTIEMQDAYNTN